MGWLDALRARFGGSGAGRQVVRCGMCGRAATFGADARGRFVPHTCGSDLLVAPIDPAATDRAIVAFVAGFGPGARDPAARDAARDALLYGDREDEIPGLEDLLYRLKYEGATAAPPDLAARLGVDDDLPVIDWSNELEMALDRKKTFAVTRRALAAAPDSARAILREKLERLRHEPLEPIED